MSYSIRDLTRHDTELMHQNWMEVARHEPDIPEVAYEKAIHWAEDVLDGKAETSATVKAVIDEHGGICAIFDVIPVRPTLPKGYFKILSLTVAPQFDLGITNSETYYSARDVLSDIVSHAIVHGLELLYAHENTCMVKMYASDRVTLRMVERAWGEMDEEAAKDAGFSTNIRGNWVEFSKPW